MVSAMFLLALSFLVGPAASATKPGASGPSLSVSITASATAPKACKVDLKSPGFPAYDPVRQQVVSLEQSEVELSDDTVGRIALVWTNAITGDRRVRELVDGQREGELCVDVHRRVQGGIRGAVQRLRKTRWEPMPTLPLEWVTYFGPYEPGDKPPTPKHVQGFVRHGKLVVRRPGITVLERQETTLTPFATDITGVYAHRKSGVVLFEYVTCAGDSCTCDPTGGSQVVRFAPQTLATIDRFPCSEDVSDCEFHSESLWDQ